MTTETVNPYPAAAPTSANPAARASLIVAIVVVAVGIVQQVVSHFIPLIMNAMDMGTASVGVIFGIFGVILGILALVALILGIVGLGHGPAGRAAAGAGAAIGASWVITVIVNLVTPLIISVLY